MGAHVDVAASATAIAAFFRLIANLPYVRRAYIGRSGNPPGREQAHRRGGAYHVLLTLFWVDDPETAAAIEGAAIAQVAEHPKLANKAQDGRGAFRRGAQALYIVVRAAWPTSKLCRTAEGRAQVRNALFRVFFARVREEEPSEGYEKSTRINL